MFKPIIRLLSFFNKEINEIRRQPRLILSLVLGPFLILLLFGVGYQGDRPILDTVLVIPPAISEEIPVAEIEQAVAINFNLLGVETDATAAMGQLRTGEIDVVQILPEDVEAQALRGEQSLVEFRYNEVNPLNEQWIQYLAYAQVNEINRSILLQATVRLQEELREAQPLLRDARANLDTVNSDMTPAQRTEVQDSLRQVQTTLGFMAASPVLLSQSGNAEMDAEQAQQELLLLRADLDAIEQDLENDNLDEARVTRAQGRLVTLEEQINVVSVLPPEVIVSPLQRNYQNIRGESLDVMTFYAPSVLALILQHIAVTLGALSIVRERLLGAFELYRVAPVSVTQILLGKYLGYTLFIVIIIGVLVGLMQWGLNVPFLGSVLQFVGILSLFTLASLGIGFLISTLSASDSQAVQLSMLVLLMSVFFSGFFLPLENFREPVRMVGYVLPLTHGITSFQAILLEGIVPSDFAWVTLMIIASATLAAVLIIAQIQFRRV